MLSQHALQVVSQHALWGGAIPAYIAGGIPACLAGGGSVPLGRGSALGGVPAPGGPGVDPPDGYCCGRYAFYWNACLF